MGQSALSRAARAVTVESESALTALAESVASVWRLITSGPVLVGLAGELGAGKTTWARGMLAGLGHTGRVPSPTYTLLEHYRVGGLDVVHADLYRLGSEAAGADVPDELEALGLRDWLGRERSWLLVEWPERSPDLRARCDVIIEFGLCADPDARHLSLIAQSTAGMALLASLDQLPEFASS